VVEIVAILAAGIWAFYVFVFENRIKPSFTDPQIDVAATLEKTSQRGGATGVLLRTSFRNTGTVRFYFAGFAVTVLGTNMTLSRKPPPTAVPGIEDNTHTYFTLSKATPVYGFGFVTYLANPKSPHGGELEPGGATEQEHTFFIPTNRFDVLTVHVSACIAKSSDHRIPAKLKVGSDGVTGVTCSPDAVHVSYDVGSLDLRK
jgi:hypothetical protein